MASAVANVAAEEAKEAEDIRKVLKSTRLVQSWPGRGMHKANVKDVPETHA